MEINLLPQKTNIEKFFWLYLFLILFLLFGIAYLLTLFYQNKLNTIASLQSEIDSFRLEQKQIEEINAWNLSVAKREEELDKLLLYQAFVDGLDTGLGPEWSVILDKINESKPAHGEIVELSASGNEVRGIAAFYSLTDVAKFMDQLEKNPQIQEVYSQLIEQPEVYKQYVVNPQEAIFLEFTIYPNDLYFITGEDS